MSNPAIKILVSYHKPAVLLKDDVLTPIHLGRALATEASKDGSISLDDYQWMLDNMIGDDTGDNISHLNREFCELTAIYWAWKNYDKLGNPDYIGFMHYRRLLYFLEDFNSLNFFNDPESFKLSNEIRFAHLDYINDTNIQLCYNKEKTIKFIKDNNFIVYKAARFNPYKHYINSPFHYITDYDKACDVISKYSDDFKYAVTKYNTEYFSYFCNMFVMPKHIFFDYANFLFDIIFTLQKIIDTKFYNQQENRVLAFLSERITGIYYTYLKNKNIIPKEIPMIYIKDTNIAKKLKPKKNNSSVICFISDNDNIKYLSVTIKSMIKNSNSSNFYEIYILENNVSENNKIKILNMKNENIYITFVNINIYLRDIDIKLLNFHYYKFLIPRIFDNYNKVLYLDSDLIVLNDISNLYNTQFNNKLISSTLDIYSIKKTSEEKEVINNLGIELNNYFNCSVLLFNIKECNKFNFEARCMSQINKFTNFIDKDKLIINLVCKDKINIIDVSWNIPITPDNSKISEEVPYIFYEQYLNSLKNKNIIHYYDIKNCIFHNVLYTDIWLQYARISPFYEHIINEYFIYKDNSLHIEELRNEISNLKSQINLYKECLKYNKKITISDFIFCIIENSEYINIRLFFIKIIFRKKILCNNSSYEKKLDRIFSIYENQKYKRITILGIKIIFKIKN